MTGRSELLSAMGRSSLFAATPPPADPERTFEAARQFEALLLQHLLQTMRKAAQEDPQEPGGLAGGETYLEIAEQHLAQALAARGGFGIARWIARGLQPATGTAIQNSADKNVRGSVRSIDDAS